MGFGLGNLCELFVIDGNKKIKLGDCNTNEITFKQEIETTEFEEQRYQRDINKEFSFNLHDCILFPKELGRYRYLKDNAKSFRVRNKNKKLYDKNFNLLMNKYFGI